MLITITVVFAFLALSVAVDQLRAMRQHRRPFRTRRQTAERIGLQMLVASLRDNTNREYGRLMELDAIGSAAQVQKVAA